MIVDGIEMWGCMPEIAKGGMDITNASSTYLSIALVAFLGALIIWLIFALQKKSSIKQEEQQQSIM